MDRTLNESFQVWMLFTMCMLLVLKTKSLSVNITYVESAVQKGAVCLDGGPPAYYFDPGSGTGINNWLIKLGGGSWCNNVTNCIERAKIYLGNSSHLYPMADFTGILNNLEEINPEFYNWNRIRIPYCDGGSFTGDIEEVNITTGLHFRGARIVPAIVEELLAKGLGNAQNAILTGCSAGGLAVYHNCDRFTSLLPKTTKVKCMADGGFFVNAKDISGAQSFEQYFSDVATIHGSVKHFHESCTTKMKPSLCFFPQYFVQDIKTPIFNLNTATDYWQVGNIFVPFELDPTGAWSSCRNDITKCTNTQIQKIQEYRSEFINILGGVGDLPSRGTFITSCFKHCQSEYDGDWFASKKVMLNNKTTAETFRDWFYDKFPVHEIGGPNSCDIPSVAKPGIKFSGGNNAILPIQGGQNTTILKIHV